MTGAGRRVQVASTHKPRRLPHLTTDVVELRGQAEPPRDACDGLQAPSAADWRQVRLALDLAAGILAADAGALAERLGAVLPAEGAAGAVRSLAVTADVLDTWSRIAREAQDRLAAVVAMRGELEE